MLFILLHHFLVHGLHNAGFDENYYSNPFAVFVDPFLFCAVNCFILISGYFGIRFKIKNIYRLYSQCFFYGLFCYLLHLFLDGAQIGRSILNNSLFVFSDPPGWWFIQVYIYLLLISPIINIAIKNISKNYFIFIIALFSVLSFYFGFIWQNPINSSGYGLVQFTYMYLIGAFLSKYYQTSRSSIRYLSIYIVSSIALGAFGVIEVKYNTGLSIFNTHIYCHPLLVLSSIGLFLFFLSHNIKSKAINYIGTSTLSVYLIHENSYVSQKLYAFIPSLAHGNDIANIFSFVLLAIFILFICISIDKIRIYIMRPIDNYAYIVSDRIDAKITKWIKNQY